MLCLPPWGKVAPQGRMRGGCAVVARSWAITAGLPSSVRFADSFPLRGSLFSAEQILVVAELDVAGAFDGEGVGLLPVGQGHVAVGIQPL